MSVSKKLLKIWWVWLAPLVGVAALALAIYFYFRTPHERHYRLTISSGESGTTRFKLAETLRAKAAEHGLTLDLRETSGSEDELEKVNGHQLDLALVQGGIHIENSTKVRQVATLHVEPLHLLVKKELADRVAEDWAALEGKTVNLGPQGSGTHLLAKEVMDFVGLQPMQPGKKGGYVPGELTQHQLHAEHDRAKLPDAAFVVASLPSETSRHLVNAHEYRLVPLAFAEAFALDGLNATAHMPTHTDSNWIERGRIQAALIPAFTYKVEPPVPEMPLPSLGTRLLVVANKDVDSHAVQRLVEVIYGSEFASVTRPALDSKLLDLPPEFTWHRGTQMYKEREAPIVSGKVMDATHRASAIAAAAVSGLFVLWQWARLRGGFHRDEGFKKYLQKVTWIEARATHLDLDQPGALADLVELRKQLARLRTEILDRFNSGELVGHELMQAFLFLAADVRDGLTALMPLCKPEEASSAAVVAAGPHAVAPDGAAGVSLSRPSFS